MANAKPVNSTTEEEVKEVAKPRKDVRRPDLVAEVDGKDKPKKTTKLPDGTVIEDY
jgi:hypothetical protein